MLKEKLKKIKQASKTYQVTPKEFLRFKSDIDTETLLSIIPKTEYTTSKYKNFNRQMLTSSQERVFNKDFTKYMKNLFPFKNEEWFDHLLDFLIQAFIVENYNVTELLFLILTDKKYDHQILFLKSKIAWMTDYVWSYSYFASMLMNEAFFDFFMDYFEFYDYAKDFIQNVCQEFEKIGNYDKIFDRVLHLLDTIKEHDIDFYREVYNKIHSHLDLEPLSNNLSSKDTLEVVKKLKIENEEVDTFEREILGDYSKIDNKNIKMVIEIYKKLTYRQSLTKYLLENYKKEVLAFLREDEISQYQKQLTINDLDEILKETPNTKLKAFNKKFIEQNIKLITEKIINIPSFDIRLIADYIEMEDLLHYDFYNDTICINIIEIAKHKSYNLSDFFISNSIFNDYTLQYIIYNLSDIEATWSLIKNSSSKYLLSCFANNVKTEILNDNVIKEMMPKYIEQKICIDKIAEIMQQGYAKHDFIQNYLKSFVNFDKRGEFIILHKLYLEKNNQYAQELFDNNCTDIIHSLCRHTNIIKYLDTIYLHEYCLKLFSILKTLQHEKNENVDANIHLFVKFFVENNERLVTIENEICSNGPFYIELLHHFDNSYAKSLFLSEMANMKQYYPRIYELISADAQKLFNLYYEVFLAVKDTILHDYTKIYDCLSDNKPLDTYNTDNLNSFILLSLVNNVDIMPYLSNIIVHCNEMTAYTCLKKYGNMMIPFLDTIITQFLDSKRIYKEIYKLNALEVIKVLIKNIEKDSVREQLNEFFMHIPNYDSKSVVSYISKKNTKKFDKHTMSSFITFCAVNHISDNIIHQMLTSYSNNDLCEIIYPALKHRPSYFDPYADLCISEMSNLNCVAEYLRYAKNSENIVNHCEQLYALFVEDIHNTDHIDCFASVLNYLNDTNKLNIINHQLLKDIKVNENLQCFDTLTRFYEHVTNFKQCLPASVTYFGIFLDHRNKEIVDRTKCLLDDIVRFTGENPYEYF